VFPSRSESSVAVHADRVVAAGEAALEAGIRPGMRLGSAWALAPTLSVRERDAELEARTLRELACWCGSFTSTVSVQAPDALLLEIGGSLRLFGGAAPLRDAATEGARALGFHATAGVAPTPLAALWRARAGVTQACWQAAHLDEALAPLPVHVLGLAPDQAAALAAWGVRTLGELLRLPRAGLANRLGAAFALELARALGELPDPRPPLAFPDTFARRVEWPAPVEHAGAILFAARRPVAMLAGWLAARMSGVRECRLVLEHAHAPAGELVLRFAEATRSVPRIERVLRERLERHTLAGPLAALRLEATRIEALPGTPQALFSEAAPRAGVPEVLERLRARLGEHRVCQPGLRADHRPEEAGRAGTTRAALPRFPRPVWLLAEPRRLHDIRGRPQLDGPLTLMGGPERIESGWWDAGEAADGRAATGDVRRDYFVARSRNGRWLWIYRDAAGWWQHGLFG